MIDELTKEEVSKIASFLGYGSLSAPVWFIGMEEGLGKMTDDDDAANLKVRATFDETMDLYEAHKLLREKGQFIDIATKPPSTQVWQYMGKIMTAKDGDSQWRNSYKEYIKTQLGRRNGRTFLTELSPIPQKKTSDKRWQIWANDRDIRSSIEDRNAKLQRALKAPSPSLVVCYGLGKMDKFANLLGIEWKRASTRTYRSHDGRCILLPFFGNGQMSHSVLVDLLHSDLLNRSQPI